METMALKTSACALASWSAAASQARRRFQMGLVFQIRVTRSTPSHHILWDRRSLRVAAAKISKFPNKIALFAVNFRFVARCAPYTEKMRNEGRLTGSLTRLRIATARQAVAALLKSGFAMRWGIG
jgi:hypothetical protein